jgi:hypothetical protein
MADGSLSDPASSLVREAWCHRVAPIVSVPGHTLVTWL